MSDVKYIYLFFKVNVLTWWSTRGELAGLLVSQPVNLLPVSVEGLRSDAVAGEVVVG